MFKNIFEKGGLTNTQRILIMSLLHKKGDTTNLNNYRPLSLTGVDYKILTYILAERVQKVLKQITNTDQKGFIKGRFIGYNIRLVQDTIEYAKIQNTTRVILFLDFKKAFDSLEWEFMYKSLTKYNFGEKFMRWIKIVYTKPGACIKNNDWISEIFDLERGVRQGCSLSALLFILSVEALVCRIRQNNEIKGFKYGTLAVQAVKICQYADDTILFLKNKAQIPIVLKELDNFGKLAGLVLNKNKTNAMFLGRDNITSCDLGEINITNQCINCLGIWVGNDAEICEQHNWTNALQKFQNTLLQWSKRKMTYFGKIVILG